jgi:hypothetical protein
LSSESHVDEAAVIGFESEEALTSYSLDLTRSA